MSESDLSAQMRDEWNARAREDAGYYVAFGRRNQEDAEFFATATETINDLESELRRVPARLRAHWKALEIGCGPGRLMRPMSRHFSEIYGVDVSDEMIALAREKLKDIPNAHPQVCDGARLTAFADKSIDFIYSYAVFQHIPSREVVLDYLREVRRVLKPGGFARLQFNGLPRNSDDRYTTWEGARFSAEEVLEFTREHDLQVLALDGASTQYMWTTWRKQPQGWQTMQYARTFPDPPARIRRITNASGSEPFAPAKGRFASITLWMEHLPVEAGLHQIRVSVGESFGNVIYVGSQYDTRLVQITVVLPELDRTGLLPIKLWWLDTLIAPLSMLRVTPPGPAVPQIRSVSDAINILAGTRIETRRVKVLIEEVSHPDEIKATVNGLPVLNLEYVCTDPRPQLVEMNFRLPEELGPGYYPLEIRIGRRKFLPITLQVV
jgi:ubiquinone/menaquinone biosynthesis C-methylase UbiE